ncbi:MAG: hypothetical protein D8M59_05360 [Planctomycetes bacterium]|nr:hypothetical protein [Planctomycetota bacterium]
MVCAHLSQPIQPTGETCSKTMWGRPQGFERSVFTVLRRSSPTITYLLGFQAVRLRELGMWDM